MTTEQFEFDPERYEGAVEEHWTETTECSRTNEAMDRLHRDAPKILAHAVALEAERDALKQQVSDTSHLAGQYVAERDALRARAERAEAALRSEESLVGAIVDVLRWHR